MSIVGDFPREWLVTVTVRRSGGRDRRGNAQPAVEHEIARCLVSTQSSAEDAQARSDAPGTVAWLFAAPGADVVSTDHVVVPDGPFWPSGLFQVSGESDKTPLGVRVPLRRP